MTELEEIKKELCRVFEDFGYIDMDNPTFDKLKELSGYRDCAEIAELKETGLENKCGNWVNCSCGTAWQRKWHSSCPKCGAGYD